MILDFIIAITIIVTLSYVLLIAMQINFFIRTKKSEKNGSSDLCLSIVVPFRNEADRIGPLIESINLLKERETNFEVIFVNDHSEDDSLMVIEKLVRFNHRVIESPKEGKKNALLAGVNATNYDTIATLDADVWISPHWLIEVRSFFEKNHDFLIMPVLVDKESGFSGCYESLDVLSLTGSTIAMAEGGYPMMCNGANMAFKKHLFLKYRTNPEDEGLVSGDDIFFMHSVKSEPQLSIGYLANDAVLAKTAAFNNLKEIINQRVRWSSKSLHYKDKTTNVVAWIVLLMYLSVTILAVGSLVNSALIKLFLINFGAKVIVDFFFLILLASRYGKLKALRCYPLAVVVQFFLIPVVLAKSIWGTFDWKERKYRK